MVGGGTEVQDRLGPFLSKDVTDWTDGRLRFLPRNAQKPASRDSECSLKNSPLDLMLAILLCVKKWSPDKVNATIGRVNAFHW